MPIVPVNATPDTVHPEERALLAGHGLTEDGPADALRFAVEPVAAADDATIVVDGRRA